MSACFHDDSIASDFIQSKMDQLNHMSNNSPIGFGWSIR